MPGREQVLFVEQFCTDVREGGRTIPARYDDDLGYSVTPDGRPFVETAMSGETRTASEVQAERDDSDDDMGTRTTTLVQAEADDWQASGLDRTETAIRAEDPDFDSWSATTTMTKVQNEAEDRD